MRDLPNNVAVVGLDGFAKLSGNLLPSSKFSNQFCASTLITPGGGPDDTVWIAVSGPDGNT